MKWAARLKEKIPDMPLGLEVSKPSKGYSVPVDTQETELSKPSKGSLDSLDTSPPAPFWEIFPFSRSAQLMAAPPAAG